MFCGSLLLIFKDGSVVKTLAIKPMDLSLIPEFPYGRRREPYVEFILAYDMKADLNEFLPV